MSGETDPDGSVKVPSPPSGQAGQWLTKEYETALSKGVVSFEQVVQAAFGRRPSQPAGSNQAIHAWYYPRLLQSFARAHKCPVRPNHSGILRYYFADHIDAAVVMTADDQLYVQFKPTGADEGPFLDLLIRMTGVCTSRRVTSFRKRTTAPSWKPCLW